ncbi:copper chaperone PCu(A)C [Phytoactinopolyspora limicola]|uniref:copper chaperone PCu(A)C n=1 Tax=Phytoactinopolyspora limicola TaxID=2715536 RepID=UPI00140C04F8|nr:copper chaperone PCu(A)C [Phytoactinopolyspora limicola]
MTIAPTPARTPRRRRRLAYTGGLALAGLVVAACGSDDDTSSTNNAETVDTTLDGGGLRIDEPWVKAADDGMTAAFGVFVNDGPDDIRIVDATTSSSPVMELHEVVVTDGQPAMREKDGGFVVPAGSEHLLEPGADHLMLMDVVEPILPGADVEFVLTLEDGATFEFTAQAKEFSGADEEYIPGEGGHGDDGHGGAPDDDHGSDEEEVHDDER